MTYVHGSRPILHVNAPCRRAGAPLAARLSQSLSRGIGWLPAGFGAVVVAVVVGGVAGGGAVVGGVVAVGFVPTGGSTLTPGALDVVAGAEPEATGLPLPMGSALPL